MRLALEQAAEAQLQGEVPIGAVVIRPDGPGGTPQVLAERHNERELRADPTAHAEILALRDAAAALGRWRLDDCIVVVTLEPCPMCAGALWASRIAGVVFGAENPEAGSLGSLYHLGQDPRLNHEFPVRHRVLAPECAAILEQFFSRRR
jgi:tRNA(adenine34) deaminase